MPICYIQQTEVYSSDYQDDRLNYLEAESAVSLQEDLNYIRSVIFGLIGTDPTNPSNKWYKVPPYNLSVLYSNYLTLKSDFEVEHFSSPDPNAGLHKNVTAKGNLYVEGTGRILGSLSADSELYVQRYALIGEYLLVGQHLNVASYANIGSYLSVATDATIGGTLSVTGNITGSSNLTIQGKATILGSAGLETSGPALIGSNLTVNGTSTLNGYTTINANTFISGTLSVGNMIFTSRTISVTYPFIEFTSSPLSITN